MRIFSSEREKDSRLTFHCNAMPVGQSPDRNCHRRNHPSPPAAWQSHCTPPDNPPSSV